MKKIIQVIIMISILYLCKYAFKIPKTLLIINKVEINKHFPIYPHGDR